MSVQFGEIVMVGDLAVSVSRTGPVSVRLCVVAPNGEARYEDVPAREILPGVEINARVDSNKIARMVVDAPREIRVSRLPRHNIL